MTKLADYLRGVSNIEGVPIVDTLEKQLHTPLPHVMLYSDGRVIIFVRSNVSRPWDPTTPLRKQIS